VSRAIDEHHEVSRHVSATADTFALPRSLTGYSEFDPLSPKTLSKSASRGSRRAINAFAASHSYLTKNALPAISDMTDMEYSEQYSFRGPQPLSAATSGSTTYSTYSTCFSSTHKSPDTSPSEYQTPPSDYEAIVASNGANHIQGRPRSAEHLVLTDEQMRPPLMIHTPANGRVSVMNASNLLPASYLKFKNIHRDTPTPIKNVNAHGRRQTPVNAHKRERNRATMKSESSMSHQLSLSMSFSESASMTDNENYDESGAVCVQFECDDSL